jgi:hypothetical protein
VTQDFVCYELVVSGERPHLSYCYRPCAFSKVFEPTQRAPWRTLKPTETMIRVGARCYLVTHACVLACHCPHCGADVGVLCARKTGHLSTSCHYARKDLYRSALAKSGKC